jgi:hypothetical protein
LFHDLNRKAGESVKLYGAENRQEEEMNEWQCMRTVCHKRKREETLLTEWYSESSASTHSSRNWKTSQSTKQPCWSHRTWKDKHSYMTWTQHIYAATQTEPGIVRTIHTHNSEHNKKQNKSLILRPCPPRPEC